MAEFTTPCPNGYDGVSGAHEWYLDANIAANDALQMQGITLAMVEQVAQRAYCDWETLIGIETRYKGTMVGSASGDGRNTLSFGNAGGVAAITHNSTNTTLCNSDDLYFSRRIAEGDITVSDATEWYVSLNPAGIQIGEFDLYSVLMHEIGHSLGHLHAMDLEQNAENDVHLMYFRIQDKQIKRGIDFGAESGTKLLKDRTLFSINTPGECFNDYKLNTSSTGCMVGTDVVNSEPACGLIVKTLVSRGESITVQTMNSPAERVSLFNMYGRRIYSNSTSTQAELNIPTSGLAAGAYFLQYYCNGVPGIEKIIIQ
ncbi:MAG TPA: T9SS type A sorting domain-containing protein [Saprospiraceae bacterium]|nr:T9SS type A sorting domain-containing protein [Saprospiraceae bacterium]HPI08256.1 T9SS type A sorting domain-containing protein [Saprospiraceae bacterium]